MNWKNWLLFLLPVFSVNTITLAGNNPVIDTIRLDTVRLELELHRKALLYIDPTQGLKPEQLPWLMFKDSIRSPYTIPSSTIEKDIYIKFAVANKSNQTIGFFFFPGVYYRDIKLFLLSHNKEQVEQVPFYKDEFEGFKKIELSPFQTTVYFAKLKFAKTGGPLFTPVLVRDYYRSSFYTSFQHVGRSGNVITFVFSGILLMMIFYSFAVYLLNHNTVFFYYAGYACCMGLMLFIKAWFFRTPSPFTYFFEAYLDFVIQSLGTFIYVAFLRKFIKTKKYYPWLDKLLRFEQITTILSITLFTYLYFFSRQYHLQNMVENYSKLLWIVAAIIFVIYALRTKQVILNYLAAGHSFLIVCGMVSMYLITFRSNVSTLHYYPGPLDNALTFYELGTAIELMFFLMALAMKNKIDIVSKTKESERLKLKTEMQDIEKQLAVLSAQQDERNRISADLHDELGSGATHIRLMSEIVKGKLKDKVQPELDKISNAANELIIKMNALIWTMKSENDSVESLITYIRIYALEFFENTAIECVVNIPPAFPKKELTGEKRRNLFLSIKETLNNVLKHSKSDKVVIAFIVDTKLLITITDNGIGIDYNNLRRFGSGLSNIKKRIESIEGTYTLENIVEGGAKTTFELVL